MALEQLDLFPRTALSVSALTQYLRTLLESDDLLQDVWVQGEISNLSRPTSGHIYFTLKDEYAALRCVIWRAQAQRLRVALQNGLAIEAHGYISLYERDGQYQLYVDALRLAGEGLLFQEFLRLKARLEAEGLFEPTRKRPIPAFPQRIGLVTSPTGAALQDMLNIIRQRYPLVEIVLAPVSVQGEEAASEVVRAIADLNQRERPSLIIVARGGGSLEDLWAFNDERVVRAIAASQAPIITGIGHETDFTLADFAADLRAPTPSAAAMLATPDGAELQHKVRQLERRLASALEARVQEEKHRLLLLRQRLERASPLRRVREDRQRLDYLSTWAAHHITSALRLRRLHLQGLQARLESLNPRAVLARGYAILQRPDGQTVQRVHQAAAGEILHAHLADGYLSTRVESLHPHPPPPPEGGTHA
ncbi:exodeoxyribonuclease VII large subunit [uncultured Thermanaerothrix sp.]|uniref:exodeoxyribonuclease VII large subunit n=1 Tax=uncultured Thermanaerothrix sp. TaxID=1195149 RepID=UPI0026233CBA|nr:exodeoxyribonuclease VII large subunit [uncultured Thermanaerothrix sp.]